MDSKITSIASVFKCEYKKLSVMKYVYTYRSKRFLRDNGEEGNVYNLIFLQPLKDERIMDVLENKKIFISTIKKNSGFLNKYCMDRYIPKHENKEKVYKI